MERSGADSALVGENQREETATAPFERVPSGCCNGSGGPTTAEDPPPSN